MLRNTCLGTFAVFAAASLTASQVVNATVITRNGVTVLSDNYDLDGAGGNDLVGNNPIADAGSWTVTGKDVTVTDAASPGPNQGSGYLQINNDGTANGDGRLAHELVAPASNNGDSVRIITRAYVPSTSNGSADYQFGGYTGAPFTGGIAGAAFITALWEPGNLVGAQPPGTSAQIRGYDGSTYATASSTFVTYDTWQTWDITYTVGATPSLVWLVDGVGGSLAINSLRSTNTLGAFGAFANGSANTKPIFFDAVNPVPEPAGLSLVALGATALVRRRRGV